MNEDFRQCSRLGCRFNTSKIDLCTDVSKSQCHDLDAWPRDGNIVMDKQYHRIAWRIADRFMNARLSRKSVIIYTFLFATQSHPNLSQIFLRQFSCRGGRSQVGEDVLDLFAARAWENVLAKMVSRTTTTRCVVRHSQLSPQLQVEVPEVPEHWQPDMMMVWW